MALIKVTDIAYGRLRAPDLDAAEEFLTHFGMVKAERTQNALYMRGTDANHHIHVTEKGDPGFVGFAYYATSEDDLKRLAKAPGASGGRRNRCARRRPTGPPARAKRLSDRGRVRHQNATTDPGRAPAAEFGSGATEAGW